MFLQIIDNKTGNHDSDGKENLKPITNADNQNDDNLSKIITPPKREPTMKFDSSLAKTETDKSVSSKTQKITSEKTLTISHANHGNDSKQGSDEKPNHSTATKGIKREHNDEPTEIAEVGMRNFSQGKDQTENESKENTKKIVHENSSQQQSKNEDGTSQTIDETADYNTNLLNDINKYLNDPPTVKVIDKGNIQQQHNVFDEASCSNTQTIKDKSKKNIKTSQQSLKPKKTKSGTVSKVKTKKKSDKAESRHEKLQYVIEQVEEMKKSVENFQQLASTAFQTLLSNWQQFQSTRAAIPSAVKAIDFENIQVPPLVGFIRSDTGMIHCGQNIWITTQDYTNAKAASSSESMFVKNIAMNIFTREVLKNSSITGNSSNRTKGPAKPKLDPTKMLAVRDIYRYYLAEHRKLPEKVINVKVDEYVEYIRQKLRT
ncbi:uncharacterized protein LOC141538274 [Cotesia typhae]|uniref:uncharacterized protein LOC141538274 n=1 Tax=Cotesia typhae TaxID=2053667 RepID=UPI003D690DE2